MNPEGLFPDAPGAAESRPAQTSSLYRLYRPQSFDSDELVGQEHVVRTLQNAIRRDRVAHAYLFCGPRGTGKTTTARILAKAVNCLDPDPAKRPCNVCAACVAINTGATTDVIEIDAASNRGIDDIRDLRERVMFAPTQLRVKFYIIDEAHQITGAAANAFLKTLEEPPPHAKFVLATTDPEELLPTIVSRCQRFDFRRLSVEDSARRMRTVADAEGIAIDDEAIELLGQLGRGSLRDALGMLDQLASFERAGDVAGAARVVSVDDVRGLLGVSRSETVMRVAAALADRDASAALTQVNAVVADGLDPRQLNRELAAVIRELLQRRAGARLATHPELDAMAERFTLQQLLDIGKIFAESDARMRNAVIPQMPLELSLVEAILGLGGEPAAAAQPRPTVIVEDGPTPARMVAEEPQAPAAPRTSLRDSVRQRTPVATPTASAGQTPAAPPQPEVASGPRRAAPASPSPAGGSGSGGMTIEWLVDEWPKIRADVKAVDRRVEALLSQADPHAIVDDLAVLTAPYQFHRDQLNKDDKRLVVEDVLSRRAGRPYRITCIDRNEGLASIGGGRAVAVETAPVSARATATAEAPTSSPSVASPSVASTAPPQPPTAGAEPIESAATAGGPAALTPDEQRLRAATSIFDADVVDQADE